MRIRKNAAKFSQLSTPPSSSSSSNTLIKKTQFLNCVLNQSPWDIITFPPPPPPNYSDSSISPPLHFQVDELEFGCAGNGSFSPSIEAIYSVPCSTASVKAYMESKVKLDFGEELEEETQLGFNKLEEEKIVIKDENKEEDIALCSEINGKGWQCGRAVKKGNNVCARHMKKGVVSGGKKSKSPEPTPVVVPARRGRGRPRTKKPEAAPVPAPASAPGANAQDPHEFYYYSGFGRLWGKNKGSGGRLSNGIGNASGIDESSEITTSITMRKNEERKRMEDEGIEYMECDDEDEDDQEDEVGKKRVRKRIKARSLKSLM